MKISSEESFRRSWNPQSLHQIQQTRRCTNCLPHRAQPIDTHTTIDTTLPDTGSHPPRASQPVFQLRAKRHKRNGKTTSPFEDNHPFEDNQNFSKNSSATPAGGVNISDYLARPLRVPQYPLPVGGRLKTFIQNWRQITADKFVLRTIHQGYTIQIDPVYRKSLFWLRQITPLPENNAHSRALLKEVQTLEQKKAIRPINSRNGLILSPVFLVTKKSGKYRMILNLKRLNHFVPNQQFKMESLSKILPLIQCNEWAATIDLSDAYLHVPVAPWSQNLLGFAIGERTYVYQALPFGLRSSPRTFTLIVRAVAAALRERGIKIFCYLDDWLILGLSQQSLNRQVRTTIDLVTSLGFIINREKSKLTPTRNPEFLGASIDIQSQKATPTPHRILKVQETASNLLHAPKSSVKYWQVFLGLLASLVDVVPQCRQHMRILQIHLQKYLCPTSQANKTMVPNNSRTRAAIQWWLHLPNLTAGKPFQAPPPTLTILTDASKQGWGAVLDLDQTGGAWNPLERNWHINKLEMVAVQRALLHFQTEIEGKSILIKSDNKTVVAFINHQGGTRSRTLCFLTLEILQWCINQAIYIRASYIPGKDNYIADFISRGRYLPTEWMLHPVITRHIFNRFGQPSVDLFASELNRQLQTYCTKHRDPKALATDAFSIPWNNVLSYAFPPFAIITRVLTKVREENATTLLIAPWWPRRPWFPTLVNLLNDYPVILPDRKDILRQPGTTQYYPNPSRLKLTLWPITGQQHLRRDFLKGLPILQHSASENQLDPPMIQDFCTTSDGAGNQRLIHPKYL